MFFLMPMMTSQSPNPLSTPADEASFSDSLVIIGSQSKMDIRLLSLRVPPHVRSLLPRFPPTVWLHMVLQHTVLPLLVLEVMMSMLKDLEWRVPRNRLVGHVPIFKKSPSLTLILLLMGLGLLGP